MKKYIFFLLIILGIGYGYQSQAAVFGEQLSAVDPIVWGPANYCLGLPSSTQSSGNSYFSMVVSSATYSNIINTDLLISKDSAADCSVGNRQAFGLNGANFPIVATSSVLAGNGILFTMQFTGNSNAGFGTQADLPWELYNTAHAILVSAGADSAQVYFNGDHLVPWYCETDFIPLNLNCDASSPIGISLQEPSGALYTDFSQWVLKATSTTGHIIEYDIQYDTAPNLGGGYCAQSPGALDAATTTAPSSNFNITFNKGTQINPYSWQQYFTNPVNNNGYDTNIYYKVCISDLNTAQTYTATSTLLMRYGGAPLNTGGATTTITFLYPTSSVFLYPAVYNYAFLANGVATTSFYQFKITDQVTGVTQIFGSTQNLSGGQILMNGITAINHLYQYDFGNATSVPITVTAALLNNQSGILTTNSLTFNMIPYKYVNASGTTINPNGTTTFVGPYPETINGQLTGNATQTIPIAGASSYTETVVCTPASDWTDIGGGIAYGFCQLSKILFFPSQNATVKVLNKFDNIKQDFPFNMVYGTVGIFLNAAQGVQYGTITNNTSTNPSLTLSIWNMDIPIMSSSSLSGFVGTSNKNLVFTVEKSAAWVAVAWTIIKVIF